MTDVIDSLIEINSRVCKIVQELLDLRDGVSKDLSYQNRQIRFLAIQTTILSRRITDTIVTDDHGTFADKYVNKVLDADDFDLEASHMKADQVLCELLKELGFQSVVEAYDKIKKVYA
jgi:hypothetical protein